jgi:hypothetical protein
MKSPITSTPVPTPVTTTVPKLAHPSTIMSL